MSIRDIIYIAGITMFLFIYDAEKQAQDIKSCQPVGACVKPKKECLQ